MPKRLLAAIGLAFAFSAAPASAADLTLAAGNIRAAVEKSLPLLTAGARGSMEKRERCFTCHNQGLPIMALAAAQSRGFKIDADELAKQLKFTADFLDKNRTNYVAGKGHWRTAAGNPTARPPPSPNICCSGSATSITGGPSRAGRRRSRACSPPRTPRCAG